ncbi:MAG: polysaccharide biosynthesis C-terminal domain-containing protein [Bacteroidetes bacterium]|nr:polysaccharide biosynthesis C-terminal domain-containing protein [Bacteroidota bacterium]
MLIDKIKSFANDTLTYGVFNMLGRFFTFLLTPLYSNYLTPAENGVMTYMLSLIVLVQIIYCFGMSAGFFRFFKHNEYSTIYDSSTYSKKIFSLYCFTVLTISSISTILLIIFSVPISNSLIGAEFPNAVYIFQIIIFIPFLDQINVISLDKLRIEHKVKKFIIVRLLNIALSFVITLYFLTSTELGILGPFLSNLIANIVLFLYLLPTIIKNINFHIDFKLFKEMLVFSLPTLPSSFSAIALQVADRPIMKLFVSNSEIGLYQINAKLAVPMLIFVTMFSYAWTPFYISHFKDSDAKPLFSRILTYYTFVSSIIVLCIVFFMDYLVRIPLWDGKTFIHSDYWSALFIPGIIAIGYLINGISINFAAVFHIEKKTKYLPFAMGTGAIISIILNFILLPIIGILGAAISLLVGYTIELVIMKALQSKVNYKINYEWKRIFIVVISSVIIYLLGSYLSAPFDLTIAFIIKIGIMSLYIVLLKLFGFFTTGEIAQIKKVFSKKKNSI